MDPALKVHEIALMVGYGDVAHFSKNFKKAVGISPMEYRSGKTAGAFGSQTDASV